MQKNNITRTASQVYLTLVPIATIVFGLAVGYISYKIYISVWIINVAIMIIATWALGAHALRSRDADKKRLVVCALFFIAPTMLTSMFFGLGAPPFDKPAAWVATATEQQVRYYFLLATGVSVAFGCAVLQQELKKTAGAFYALLAVVATLVAIPVFLINTTFWGFYLAELYGNMVAAGMNKTPGWVLPIIKQFHFVNMITTALTYIATAAFAMSLKKAGWFKPLACNIYIIISLLFFLLDVLPPSLPEPFGILNLIVSIPAIPFVMPYFIGIHLLKGIHRY